MVIVTIGEQVRLAVPRVAYDAQLRLQEAISIRVGDLQPDQQGTAILLVLRDKRLNRSHLRNPRLEKPIGGRGASLIRALEAGKKKGELIFPNGGVIAVSFRRLIKRAAVLCWVGHGAFNSEDHTC